jgi:threonine aldolase
MLKQLNMIIDLRSDTVTMPSKGMLEAMMIAPLGDDVFGEDPTVSALEAKAAALFGKEAGLFCPSGTMTNQVALRILSRPQEELICDRNAHVFMYEGGGPALHSGLSVWLLDGDRGRITAAQVEEAVRPAHDYYPRSSVVAIENTHNRGGGSIYPFSQMAAISETCHKHHLKLHLDGARIFNAIAESAYSARELGGLFDTISVCLSKGLGAPAGSVLLASKDLIREARRVRKVMGGGMRQAGILAAAGIYALDYNMSGLKADHRRAKALEQALSALPFVEEVVPVETNIVITRISDSFPVDTFISRLEAKRIKTVPFGKQAVRMVTHLDFDDNQLDYAAATLRGLA